MVGAKENITIEEDTDMGDMEASKQWSVSDSQVRLWPHTYIPLQVPASVAHLDLHPTGDQEVRVQPPPGRQHSFEESQS